jgi:hypothetical protein
LAVLKGFLVWHDKSRKLGVGSRKDKDDEDACPSVE